MPRWIDVRIEELVLDGFSRADRLRIGAAVEVELSRLLASGSIPPGLVGGGHRDSIDAGSFTRGPVATPSAIGQAVARSVYGGLAR